MENFVSEYKRYKTLLESSLQQVSEEQLHAKISENANSIAVILNHISGNFISRFTDFLNTDGEKEWRNRDAEFSTDLNKHMLLAYWQKAWSIVEDQVFSLRKEDLMRQVRIRGVALSVEEALTRSLAHFSYHVGEIVLLAKHFAQNDWQYLSIAPGESAAYNRNPTKEKMT